MRTIYSQVKDWFLRLVKIRRTYYILIPHQERKKRLGQQLLFREPGDIISNLDDIVFEHKFPHFDAMEYRIECTKEDLVYLKLMNPTMKISEKTFRKTMMR